MYKLKNDGQATEILCYGDIGFGGITAMDVIKELKESKAEHLILRINSAGGDLAEALGLYGYLSQLSIPRTVIIDGICASAASILAMSGTLIIMPEEALMMIHNPWTESFGDADSMRKAAEMLDYYRDSCVTIYNRKTGIPPEELTEMMKSETWMHGSEAKAKGFVDEVSGEVVDKVKEAYNAGVEFERSRLRELDELMCSGREEVIMKAKYETYKKADEVAKEILSSETQRLRDNRILESYDLREVQAGYKTPAQKEREAIRSGAEILNKMRGY